MNTGPARRRVRAPVIGLMVLVSTGASILALALVVDSNSPFDTAFAAQHGADITATVNPTKATSADRRHQCGNRDQAEHRQGHSRVHPGGYAQGADLVDVGGPPARGPDPLRAE